MIKVRILRNGVGRISAFSVQGHSGTAEKGKDIVCAGVSALAQTAFLGIREHLHRRIAFAQASGDFQAELESEPDDLTDAILETMLLGLQQIQQISPKAVRISDSKR
jgi:uncharacterized protein YsxB (DUF464 family)